MHYFLFHFNREKKTSLESGAAQDAPGAKIFPFISININKHLGFLVYPNQIFGKICITFSYTSIEKRKLHWNLEQFFITKWEILKSIVHLSNAAYPARTADFIPA
jgi:hypothetical protein